MKSKLLMALLLSVGLLTICGTVMAHHASAAYADKPMEFKNVTTTKFSWINPHSLIYFDAKDANGNVVNWTCETAAPQALRLLVWSKESVALGDVVSIRLYQATSGNRSCRLIQIAQADRTRSDACSLRSLCWAAKLQARSCSPDDACRRGDIQAAASLPGGQRQARGRASARERSLY